MSESNDVRESAPVLANAGVRHANVPSFRSTVPPPANNYVTTAVAVPVLPPRPEYIMAQNQNYGMSQGYGMGSYGGMGGMGSYGMGGMGTMGGYGGYSMGGYGGYGMGGMGMGMSGQNPYGYGNIESRFIQMAEENSRPAFDTIQSFVHAVGGVSMMLENTFFAMTSSFRAILGVAENFGRLRSLFAQFWTTFGMIRSINWLIRKLLVMLGIRTEDEFKAWAEAVAATQGPATQEQPRSSSWPVLLFFAVVAAAPYLVLKMMNGVTSSIESLNDPKTWSTTLKGIAQHAFQAGSPQELSFSQNQILQIAPQALQGNLWNSGWLVATTDGSTAGLVPATYIKIIQDEATANQKQDSTPQLHCSLNPST